MNRTPLDLLAPSELVDALITGQEHVTAAVRAAAPALARGAEVAAESFIAGGRILLVGAGTSGRLAAMEAAELPGTFGIPRERVVARVAGESQEQQSGADAAEDDAHLGRTDISALGAGPGDVVIAVAASGTTPYTLAAAEVARSAGAVVIAVDNAEGTPLAALSDVAIEMITGEEVLVGSTRLAAGSAQKLALNTLTTAAMVRAGRVHDRFMVDVVPANAKLVRRVADLVAEICQVDVDDAVAALDRCDRQPRVAIVHLLTGLPPDEAARRAAAHRTVREAAAPASAD
ncbi:MAG: N-acetylmuramic acid 6-phosphate etherase [Blastococcus sp.]